MAEIKVLKGTETQIGPVGIVQMGSGGVRVGQQMEQAGKRLFDIAFQTAYDNEKKKGQEEATLAAISARDPKTGKLIFPEIPKSLSRVAQKYYEPIANKRYQDALLLDIDENAKRIAAQTERNPEEFAKQFQTYIDTTSNNAGKFSNFVQSTGAITSKQYQTKLFVDEVEFQDKLASQNAVVTLYKAVDDIEAMARSGAVGSARAMLDSKMEELQGFMAEHGDRVGQAFQIEMMKKLRGAFVGGDMVNIRSKLQDAFPSLDPYSSSPAYSIALNQMAIALENRSLDGIPQEYRDALQKAGLTQKYLEDSLFAGLNREMARQTRTAQGTVQEAANQQRNALLTDVALNTLANGGSLTSGQGDLVLERSGLRTSVDLQNNLATVLMRPQDPIAAQQWDAAFGATHQLLFNTESDLPKVINDYLGGVMSMNAEQLPVAIALYQQATRFNRGTMMDINHRGLDDKTVMAFETLLNVRDVLGDEGLPEFMNGFRLKDKATSEEIKANINSKLGKEDGSNYKRNVREFVTNNINDDASEDEIQFYTRFADDLLYSMDANSVQRILKSAGDAVFSKSKYLHKTIGRSRFTPERAYPNSGDMKIFEEAVRLKLSAINPNLKLGKDVFLVPDTREGSALPVYTLVDESKNILRINGKPATVGNQYVVQELARRRNITVAQLRSEAAASRELFIRNQRLFESLDDPQGGPNISEIRETVRNRK